MQFNWAAALMGMMKRSAEWIFTCVSGIVRRAEKPCVAGIQSPQRSSPSKIARNRRKTRPNFDRRNTKMEPVFPSKRWIMIISYFRRCRSVVWKYSKGYWTRLGMGHAMYGRSIWFSCTSQHNFGMDRSNTAVYACNEVIDKPQAIQPMQAFTTKADG